MSDDDMAGRLTARLEAMEARLMGCIDAGEARILKALDALHGDLTVLTATMQRTLSDLEGKG